MNNLLIKFIAGFVCTARWRMENSDVAAESCETEYLKNRIYADCRNKGIYSVPSNLDPKINVNRPNSQSENNVGRDTNRFDKTNLQNLDLSNNDICHFTRGSFSKYKSLKELLMTDLTCSPRKTNQSSLITIENDTFVNSNSLEILDISNSPICSFGLRKFKWPKNLKKLILHNSRHIAFQFLELEKLEILIASNCDKHSFPELHDTAPLHEIDLLNNNISYVTAEMVAIHCDLETLRMSMLVDDLKAPEPQPHYDDFCCMCQRFKNWTELRDISGLEDLRCYTKSVTNNNEVLCTTISSCNMSFDEANKLHDSCRSRGSNLFVIILFALVFIILIGIPIVWFLKKSFSTYGGRRSEIIEDQPDRDFPSSYYESDSERESDRTIPPPTKRSFKKIPFPFIPKKLSRTQSSSQPTPKKLSSKQSSSQATPKKHNSKRISTQSIKR